jgi:hypothetical protein
MSLRGFVLFVAVASLAAGIAALVLGLCPPALVFVIWGLLLVIGTVGERIVYKPMLKQAPGPAWQRTSERFIDPQTGTPVTVYADPASGERQYVQE